LLYLTRIGVPYVGIKLIVTGNMQDLCIFQKELGILSAPFATGEQLLLVYNSHACCVGRKAGHSAQLHVLYNYWYLGGKIIALKYSTGNE